MGQEDYLLPLIFSVTGGIALLGLSIFTTIATFKHRLPKCLRIILSCVCVVGATCLSAFLLCHYGLRTIPLQMTPGDQVLMSPSWDADLDSRLLRMFCTTLRMTSDKPGLVVWTAALSPGRVTDRSYNLVVNLSKEPPTVVPLRLSIGDQLTIQSAPADTQMAIYAHENNWFDWQTAGLQQEAHELCCAWWQLRPIRPPVAIEMEKSGQHRVVLRGPPDGSVTLSITRSRYEAAVCDPVVCDAIRVNACRLDVYDRPSILEIRVADGSANSFESVRVWVACEYRGWAIALFSSMLPLSALVGICLLVWCRRQYLRQIGEMRMEAASPVYAHTGPQTPGSYGEMKPSVDFV